MLFFGCDYKTNEELRTHLNEFYADAFLRALADALVGNDALLMSKLKQRSTYSLTISALTNLKRLKLSWF